MIAGFTKTRGFTLLETLVALFLLSLISAAATALLLGSLRTSGQVEQRSAELQKLDLTQTFLRNDIAAMSIRGIMPDDGFGQPGNLFGGDRVGGEPFLQFVRSGWINPGALASRSSLQLVRYRLENGALIREAILRPDFVRATPNHEQILLTGVQDVSLRFYRNNIWSDIWVGDAGQPLSLLPDLIEIRLIFENGRELSISTMTGGRR